MIRTQKQQGLDADAYLEGFPEETQVLANRLRGLIARTVPGVKEAVSLGWQLIQFRVPVGGAKGRRDAYFAFVIPKLHGEVTLGFEWGILVDDPERLLIGEELKQVRYMPIRSEAEIREAALARLIGAAAEVAALSQREKRQRLLEAEEIAYLERGRRGPI